MRLKTTMKKCIFYISVLEFSKRIINIFFWCYSKKQPGCLVSDNSGVKVCVWGGSESALESVIIRVGAHLLFHCILSIIYLWSYWLSAALCCCLPLTARSTERETTQGLSLCECLSLLSNRAQLNPNPAPFGLWDARIGSVMPLPSGPKPEPGVQPIVCSIRFPTFDSGRGGTPSPTTPEREREG